MKKIVAILLVLSITTQCYGYMGGLMSGTSSDSVCSASYGSELNTTQTCTAPAGITESDVTTGWAQNGTLATFDSLETAPNLGTSHIAGVADAANEGLYYDLSGLSLSAGTIYRLQFDARRDAADANNWYCALSSSATSNNAVSYAVTSTTYATNSTLFLYNVQEDTLACRENNGSNLGGVYVDNVSVKTASICQGNELHTTSNAASIGSEADATTGWTSINNLDSFISSSSGSPGTGTYHLRADNNTTPDANAGFNIDLSAAPFSLQNGTNYFVRFKAKHTGVGNSWVCGFSSSSTGVASTSIPYILLSGSQSTYAEFGLEITSYSASYAYFVCTESSSTDNNGAIDLDGFSVKEITAK